MSDFITNGELRIEAERLCDENAKLRELVRAAYNCTNAGPSCLECRVVAGGCTLLSAMRELGKEEGRMSQWLTKGRPTDDLLKCANCGGDPEWRDGSSTTPYIRCKSCGMRTGSSRDYEKLKMVWNRRDGA